MIISKKSRLAYAPSADLQAKRPGTSAAEKPWHQEKSIQVGVFFRNDQRGQAHEYDKRGIDAMNQIDGKKFNVKAISLPRGARGQATPVRTASWSDLNDIDMIYAPGAPIANDTQVGDTPADALMNVPKPGHVKEIERVSRAPYELRLLQMAQTKGVPVLAVCAGSWRLLQAHGGQVRTLPEQERNTHINPEAPWALEHNSKIEESSHVADFMNARQIKTNSLHWATADESEPNKLVRRQDIRDPNTNLQVSARTSEPGQPATVEAFETRHGVPQIGVQWHPEAYLPGMRNEETATPEQRVISQNLFRGLSQAADSRRAKRKVLAQLEERQKR